MLDFLKENKGFAIIGAILVLVAGAYFAYSTGSGGDELLTSTGAATETSQVSRELLATLADLKNISLDSRIFTDPAFTSLVDFGVAIPLQPVGRDNPFAPLIGGVRVSTTTPQR